MMILFLPSFSHSGPEGEEARRAEYHAPRAINAYDVDVAVVRSDVI